MFIKVRSGEHGRPVKTAGNPVRIGGYRGNNIVDPISAPTLNQHREAILHEFMAARESYVPAYAEGAEDESQSDPAGERASESNVTPLKQKQL
jgi:CoA:oxalate CoA-transferase